MPDARILYTRAGENFWLDGRFGAQGAQLGGLSMVLTDVGEFLREG